MRIICWHLFRHPTRILSMKSVKFGEKLGKIKKGHYFFLSYLYFLLVRRVSKIENAHANVLCEPK